MIQLPSYYSPFQRQWTLCYYIPQNNTDSLTGYIIDFKNGVDDRINCWSNWLIDELRQLGISFDYVMRSLGSSEIRAAGKPLDLLGQRIERELRYKYSPGIIYKTRTTQKLSMIPKKADREKELEGVYKLSDDCPNLSGKRVLLLDDVATSGATSNAIVKEIKQKYPTCQIYLFTLAKTMREDNANEGITLQYFQDEEDDEYLF